jgi:adenosylmethionine-8-amino-7-oxononanoate aminotransferase
VESAIKLAQQYHRINGDDQRVKVVSRKFAYHGTTLGALGVTGLPGLSDPFQPLRPVHLHAPNTNAYRPEVDDPAAAMEELILEAGPETVSVVIAEPVQNAGGSFTPPDGYWQELRAICDRHGILLVADEVITAFGRLGYWTGSEKYGVVPDMITFAKGVTSAYAPLGGVAFGDRFVEPLSREQESMFLHGATWGGHPVATAVGIANIDVFEKEDLLGNVLANEQWLGDELRRLQAEHEMVGDVRGTGYFWALELVADRDKHVQFTDEQSERLLRGFLSRRLLELGLICRADDRDEPVIQVSPPLVADREVLGELVGILDQVLGEARKRMQS